MLFRSPFFFSWLYPSLVWRIPTSEKIIYLTFDDGPVPEITEFVLDTLARYNAKATFFCIGDNVRKYPDIFKKVIEGGHTFGNHTFNHLKGWNYSVTDYIDNVNLCRHEFMINTDLPSGKILFRPPYGRIKRAQIAALSDYKIIMWDVLTHDYAVSVSPERVLKGSLRATRPGSVVVFHDSIKAARNMKFALPKFLEHFSKLGYSFHVIPGVS